MSKAPSTDTDPWDHLVDDAGGTGVPACQKTPPLTRAIPDDWDDDPSSSDEDSQKIWEDANKAGPMPELVLASSSSGSTPNVVPPASAFQSPVRILKRSLVPPQKYTNTSPSASSTTETFAERSARYNAARERIFADTIEGKVNVGSGDGGAASPVLRNPKGPGHSPELTGRGREGSHGFAERIASRRGDPSIIEEKE
ncbi:hypothetical protein EI94DRAFT_1722420 [Lactarius quietus]|nr:hypothetical protein EI94DRAFT_1722420 [Lactarius quietus]